MKLIVSKKLLIVLLLAVSITSIHAQTKRSLGFGVRSGVNISDYTNSWGEHRTGFVIGGYTDLYFTPNLAIELGGYYSVQGNKNSYIPQDYNGKIDTKLDYGELQFGVKYIIIGGFRAQAMVGTEFLLKSQSTLHPMSTTGSEQLVNDLYNTNNINLNFSAGVGYRFKFGLDLSASYIRGLTPLFHNSDNYTSMYRLTLGWRIIAAKLKK